MKTESLRGATYLVQDTLQICQDGNFYLVYGMEPMGKKDKRSFDSSQLRDRLLPRLCGWFDQSPPSSIP